MGQLQFEKTRVEEQCELQARRGGGTIDVLDIASNTNQNLREKIRRLGLSLIQNLLTFSMTATVYRAILRLPIAVVKRLTSVYVLPVSVLGVSKGFSVFAPAFGIGFDF